MRLHLALAVAALIAVSADVSGAQEKKIVVALIGDSTVTARSGWGAAFAGRFDDRVKVLNFAASGRSSKSYYC